MNIKVVNREYAVVFEPSDVCEHVAVFGWCDKNDKVLHIDANLGPAMMREIMWHEVLHALIEEYGFPEKQSEERTVTFLAKAVAGFVENNPAFVRKYLL